MARPEHKADTIELVGGPCDGVRRVLPAYCVTFQQARFPAGYHEYKDTGRRSANGDRLFAYAGVKPLS